jgi:hypothetical protein
MAIISTNVGTIERGGWPAVGPKLGLIENTIDFSIAANNVDDADVVEFLAVPAGTLVLFAGVDVLTAEGHVAEGDLGDGGSGLRYVEAANIEVVANTANKPATVPYLYTSADTIDLICDHALDAAKVRVWALIADVADITG